MAKQNPAPAKRGKACSCGATTGREHIQAVMMGAGMHPYTGPNR